MDAAQLADLRTMYVFTPLDGQTWGLTCGSLKACLLERDPDEFVRIQEGGQIRGSVMYYGITLDGEELEGYARVRPEGVSILDSTAQAAANFAGWLREHVVPEGLAMTLGGPAAVAVAHERTLIPETAARVPRMGQAHRARLVEAIEALPSCGQEEEEGLRGGGTVWRSSHRGRDPLAHWARR
ncbi:hypothetical protein [Streptomyces goshikiensis]|uniref:hypothetical protein n=1 Tax=Streptomyces goshikiensis TaxID=1942 RepID=UPI0036CD2103